MSGATRPTATKGTRRPGGENEANSQTGTGKTSLQILLEVISEQRNMISELREVVNKQRNTIEELHRQSRQTESALLDTKAQLSEELRQAREQIDALVRNSSFTAASQPSPRTSYADIARTPPASQPSGVRTLSTSNTTPSTFTDTLFCTIDTLRVEEGEKEKV